MNTINVQHDPSFIVDPLPMEMVTEGLLSTANPTSFTFQSQPSLVKKKSTWKRKAREGPGLSGFPEATRRVASWDLLRAIKPIDNVAWICIRDFNEVLYSYEKFSAADRPFRLMEAFRSAMEDCALREVPFQVDFFTWSNSREGNSFPKEKLDRALGNQCWFDGFLDGFVSTLVAQSSDHAPIFLSVNSDASFRGIGSRPFRYEANWFKRDGCEDVVKRAWGNTLLQHSTIRESTQGLQRCQEELFMWSKANNQNLKHVIFTKRNQIKHLQSINQGDRNSEIFELKREVDSLLEEEDLRWKQRAKQLWLKEGDKNTKFFHRCASQRRKVNSIKSITNDYGRVLDNPKEVSSLFQSFFQHLFTSIDPASIDVCLRNMQTVVTPEMNVVLTQGISNYEVERAVFTMNAMGSLGPDGFPALFYQNHWEVVGSDICAAIKDGFLSTEWPQEFNATHITLIPKVKNPSRVTEFKPISLCNVIYNILAKMGFDYKWIEVILRCVYTISYSILLNGIPQSSFTPSRGIRQGDPLSPYLFILCSESLSNSIQYAESSGAITGVPLGRNHASGQRLNKYKTSILFSKNTKAKSQVLITQIAGFRDLEHFNLAMLAKQWWRLLQYPESLAAKVLSTKYFPDGQFLNATITRHPSLIWRSIMAAKPLLEEGLFWRVGNGANTKIWHHKWLPIPTSFKVQSTVEFLDLEETISALIDHETKTWRTEVIDHIFLQTETEIIRQIPISYCNSLDKIVWRCTTNGIFSVKSAYHLQLELHQREAFCALHSASLAADIELKQINLEVNFIPRSCNNLAHCLTKDALNVPDVLVDIEDVPSCIASLL
ncbi:uncharacterized protein LOC122276859 [Carya illinoinensis]|uniref:uncharacterized protein LOC122276859 n=1 Tax=Carya illinoinensis TaxID=32201 RepID=UPI001C71B40D|nr:uncharacterized protein LOC122276859 [Carya illinoinensis]